MAKAYKTGRFTEGAHYSWRYSHLASPNETAVFSVRFSTSKADYISYLQRSGDFRERLFTYHVILRFEQKRHLPPNTGMMEPVNRWKQGFRLCGGHAVIRTLNRCFQHASTSLVHGD
jgi:hypothetical protein